MRSNWLWLGWRQWVQIPLLVVALLVMGYATRRSHAILSLPSGVASGLQFVATRTGQAALPYAPLSLREFTEVRAELAPVANVAGFMVVEELVGRSDGRASSQLVAVSSSAISEVIGRFLIAGTLNEGGCLSVGNPKKLGATLTLGETASCLETGAVDPAVADYLFPGVSVFWIRELNASLPMLQGKESYGVIRTLVSPRAGISARVVLDRLQVISARLVQSALTVIQPSEYLFSEDVRRSTKLLALTGGSAMSLAVCAVLTLTFLNLMLFKDRFWIERALGARPKDQLWGYAVRSARACIAPVLAWGALLIVVRGNHNLAEASELATILIGSAAAIVLGDGAFAAVATRFWNSRVPVADLVLCTLQASAIVLAALALTYLASLRSMTYQGLGVEMTQATVTDLAFPRGTTGRSSMVQDVLQQVREMRGVAAVSVSTQHPLMDAGFTTSVTIENGGRFLNGNADDVTPGKKFVSPDYFDSLGAPLVEGRSLSALDGAGARRAVVVNQAAAHAYWPTGDVVGRRLKFRRATDQSDEWAEVVGVVSNVRHEGFRGKTKPEVYLSIDHENPPLSKGFVTVRWTTSPNPDALAQAISALGIGLGSTATLQEAARKPIEALFDVTRLVSIAAAMCIVGFLMAFTANAFVYVRESHRRLGISLALGAQLGRAIPRILLRNWRLAAVTTVLGIVLALAFGRYVASIDSDVRLAAGQTIGAALALLAVQLIVSGAVATKAARSSISMLLKD